jgi:hypothetical protein
MAKISLRRARAAARAVSTSTGKRMRFRRRVAPEKPEEARPCSVPRQLSPCPGGWHCGRLAAGAEDGMAPSVRRARRAGRPRCGAPADLQCTGGSGRAATADGTRARPGPTGRARARARSVRGAPNSAGSGVVIAAADSRDSIHGGEIRL